MRDHLEADRFYSVMTEGHGKLELRARGARKISAKLASHLEPFALCDLMVVRGRYGDIVAGVERLENYSSIRQDSEKMLLALQTL
ncbi:MAG: recombination protein O N-terminal domain-containing protein, partial [Patescibacteria group bacterium]